MFLLNEWTNEWMNEGWLEESSCSSTPSSVVVGLEASGKDSPPTVVPGILGGSVTFSLNISVDTEIEHVAWSGPQKALALAVTETQVIIMDKSYQNRLNISWNYSLSISNLTLKDAGSYKAQINRKNSEVTIDEEFILRVYGEF